MTPNANSGTPFIMGTGPLLVFKLTQPILPPLVLRISKRQLSENLVHSAPKKPRKGRSLGLLLDSTMPNIPPEMVTPSPSNRSWGNEDLPGAHLDVSDPDAEKLDCFFAFLQDNLKLN
jgi:hypothetical protein